jgi:hypothetical protein
MPLLRVPGSRERLGPCMHDHVSDCGGLCCAGLNFGGVSHVCPAAAHSVPPTQHMGPQQDTRARPSGRARGQDRAPADAPHHQGTGLWQSPRSCSKRCRGFPALSRTRFPPSLFTAARLPCTARHTPSLWPLVEGPHASSSIHTHARCAGRGWASMHHQPRDVSHASHSFAGSADWTGSADRAGRQVQRWPSRGLGQHDLSFASPVGSRVEGPGYRGCQTLVAGTAVCAAPPQATGQTAGSG